MSHLMPRRILAFAGLLALLGGLVAAGPVLAPPPSALADLPTWWWEHGPLEATITAIRLLALVGTSWLTLITALDLCASALRLRPLHRLVDRLSPALWRNLVLRPLAATAIAAPQVAMPIATMSLAAAEPASAIEAETATTEAGGGPVTIPVDTDRVLVMAKLDAARDQTTPSDGSDTAGPSADESGSPDDDQHADEPASDGTKLPTAEGHRVDDTTPPNEPGSLDTPTSGRGAPRTGEARELADPGPSPVMPPAPTSAAEPARVLTMTLHEPIAEVAVADSDGGSPPAPTPTPTSHVVEPGESLWSIAADHLGSLRGDTPSAADVAPYWRQLIELNRAALPDPHNPDLIYRGIELQLPALDA